MNAKPALKGAEQPVARYLTKVIDGLQGQKSQREIAAELGYDKPNIISMFKKGEMKVPLDKIPAFAKAIHVDPAFFFRLAMEQYWPDLKKTVNEIFGDIVSTQERNVIDTMREVARETRGADEDAYFPEEWRDEFAEWYRAKLKNTVGR